MRCNKKILIILFVFALSFLWKQNSIYAQSGQADSNNVKTDHDSGYAIFLYKKNNIGKDYKRNKKNPNIITLSYDQERPAFLYIPSAKINDSGILSRVIEILNSKEIVDPLYLYPDEFNKKSFLFSIGSNVQIDSILKNIKLPHIQSNNFYEIKNKKVKEYYFSIFEIRDANWLDYKAKNINEYTNIWKIATASSKVADGIFPEVRILLNYSLIKEIKPDSVRLERLKLYSFSQ